MMAIGFSDVDQPAIPPLSVDSYVESLGNPPHSTLQALIDDWGYDGELLETGYTPYLDGRITRK